ncbi:P-loop NTPase fold protein [Flavobacterium sp. IB48]|uniref:P-loop NTPase fold protein n=1 Tax=Flavobacterium sp. IB48 TaxID=2779375 RepID=UPI0018E84784|nr:P-loop NTPase fold protein [Flavobacterium sp. IB48]MBJ2124349.1 hypothetical protein [Flavobacterium sp. IB48]
MIDLYQIALNPSPADFNFAFAPINKEGAIGNLNSKILLAFGYNQTALNGLNLERGCDLLTVNESEVMFVVTIDGQRPTAELIRENLSKSLNMYALELSDKKIFLPLLGTGNAGLSYEESYEIISSVLEENHEILVSVSAEFIIAIPEDQMGKELYNKLILENNIDGSDIIMALQNSNYRFFLVGSNWDGVDQASRFYEQGIWETGYDEKYAEVINSINEGDFLIHKSTYPNRDGDSFLRFKGWGRVSRNLEDGTTVAVKWMEKDHKIDIKDLGFYRNTITQLSFDDMQKIFDALPQVLLDGLIGAILDPPEEDSHHIAGLVCDGDTGIDYLNIGPDVNAFSLVLAAKTFRPPLAVALLGKWGSGKSFFMNKLRKEIEDLSASRTGYFCEGIVHVHFNAWSYMDTNLWASITTNIFDELNYYIKNDSLAKNNTRIIEEKLVKDLSAAKEEVALLENQKNEIDSQLKKLDEKKKDTKEDLDTKIKLLRNKSLQSVLNEVDTQFKVETEITKALTENPGIEMDIAHFKKIVPEEYWVKPDELYEKAKSLPTYFKLFTTDKAARYNWLWVFGTLAIIFLIPLLLGIFVKFFKLNVVSVTPSLWILITAGGALYVRAVKTYRKFQPFLRKMWTIKEDYLKQRVTAIDEFNQQEKALLQEIEYKTKELDSINTQITSVTVVKSTIEYKITNALTTSTLYDFIEKRCNSDDYKKHLGLVSIIRKDFQILSELFTGHSEELLKSGESAEFRALFNKPLERIILYIDDLDRCPEERVVEVLEAVNLLMAFPLFVVVVGVDPVWVRNALTVKYLQKHEEGKNGYKGIDPSDYLEKIFQIAFHLKTADDNDIKEMLRGLSEVQELPKVKKSDQTLKPDQNEDAQETLENADPLEQIDYPIIQKQQIRKETIVKALSFTEEERSFIEEMSIILGSNPRLIKRFINIYRIIKSHEYMRSPEIGKEEIELVLLTLALSLSRYRPVMTSILKYSQIPNQTGKLGEFLSPEIDSDDTFDLKDLKDLRRDLLKVLAAYKPESLEVKLTDFNKNAFFIKRFAF